MKRITLQTEKQYEIRDITDFVNSIVERAGVNDGLCNIFAPHATAAIILNENADPNVMRDIIQHLSETVEEGRWRHDAIDGNGAAHIKSAIVGASKSVPIADGKLALGTWQNIMFCEFDGPKKREVLVTIIRGS